MVTDTEFINALRSAKMSTVELADGLGVSQPTIRRWRNGRNLPYSPMRPAIMLFLGKVDKRRAGVVNQIQRTAFDAYEGLNGRMPTKL
jgi:hypothetical protein